MFDLCGLIIIIQMTINRNVLLDDLVNKTERFIKELEMLKAVNLDRLNAKASSDAWSVLECIEHLNLYGRFYIPELKKRIAKAPSSDKELFKPGRLGNYFAKAMLPGSKMKSIKTFASMNPNGSKLSKSTLDEFIQQQHDTLKLLVQARKVDLTKTKTAISITNLIRIRLGDTLRVVVFHNLRHMKQAQRALNS